MHIAPCDQCHDCDHHIISWQLEGRYFIEIGWRKSCKIFRWKGHQSRVSFERWEWSSQTWKGNCKRMCLKKNVTFTVQVSHSVMSDSLWPHGLQHARPPCPSPTLGVYSIHVHWVSDAIQPSHPLSSPSPPASLFPRIRVFSNESTLCIRWPKYWSFSFNISPSNEYSGLVSFRMDWLDLLSVQRTLKSPLQHHSSKASILQCSTFFIVQLSHPYITTGKTIALTRWTFVDKVMSLLFNMLTRLCIAFLLGHQWPSAGAGAQGAEDLGMA